MNKIKITLLGTLPLGILFGIIYLLGTHKNIFLFVLLVILSVLVVFLCYNVGQLLLIFYDDFRWQKDHKKVK